MSLILCLTLPFPVAALSPNGRDRWNRINAVTAARQLAYYTTQETGTENWHDDIGPLAVMYEFYPPTKSHYDLDGLISRCKAYTDGIFDALGIDDNLIVQIAGRRCEVVKGGKVKIEIREVGA